MQVDIQVDQLARRPRARTGRRGGVDHRPHRHPAFLNQPEQQAQLLPVVVARHDEYRLLVRAAEPVPQGVQLPVGEFRRTADTFNSRAIGIKAQVLPKAIAGLPGTQPRLGVCRGPGENPAVLHRGVTGFHGQHAGTIRDGQPRVIDLDGQRIHCSLRPDVCLPARQLLPRTCMCLMRLWSMYVCVSKTWRSWSSCN